MHSAAPSTELRRVISVVVISKDEPELDVTLRLVEAQRVDLDEPAELIVVDASEGRLASIPAAHPEVHWIDFHPNPPIAMSIPHQRNVGVSNAHGDVIVFTDAGCRPRAGWLKRLAAEIRAGGESVVCGLTVAVSPDANYYNRQVSSLRDRDYVDEAPTINLAFTRSVFDEVSGFDETFEYGSDLDFTWRIVDRGYRIRMLTDAVVEADWGARQRQFKRAFRYGRARVRLYLKHANRRRRVLVDDPIVVVYPLFLLGLPLTLIEPMYPLLLILPLWRARGDGPLMTVADHLCFGAGALSALVEEGRRRRRAC